jgi:deoxyadenosine/deoxycytidine kinase
MQGRIIAVVGAPRTGKSYLVKKLAEHYRGSAFYEGEESDIPERIKEDIAQNIRPLERTLWFRNRLVDNYQKALDVRSAGGIAVLDSVYIAVDLYVSFITQDAFEQQILRDLAQSDIRAYGMPDKIIHLTSTEEKIKEFIQKGGRTFDAGESYFDEHVLPVEKAWREYLENHVDKNLVVEINRADLDFEKQEDFESLLSQIAI